MALERILILGGITLCGEDNGDSREHLSTDFSVTELKFTNSKEAPLLKSHQASVQEVTIAAATSESEEQKESGAPSQSKNKKKNKKKKSTE